MAVYVDDRAVEPRFGQAALRYSRLIADRRGELHAFAARLGVPRGWFHDPAVSARPPAVPGSRAAEDWHYTITAGQRAKAISLGAHPVHWRQLVAIVDHRYAHRSAQAGPPVNGPTR
jgi:hypothetical protein